MGKNFKMNQWSDSWLKTSGIDLLEGVATYDQNKNIQQFAIKQTFDKNIDLNRLREQKLDIAFYDSDFQEHIIKGIVLSDKHEIKNITLNFTKPMKAF